MRYYLGPRVPGTGDESDWLLSPEGSAGLIDLRPGWQRADGWNGLCLIASPVKLNSDYRLLHDGDIRDAVMPERERRVWTSALGLKGCSGDTLAHWLYDTLTNQSDPTGEGIGPLLPSWQGMEIFLDGLVIRRPFDLKSPEAKAVIDLRRRQYRAIRAACKDIDPTLHRRLLTDWGLKYRCECPEDVFIPSDLPREAAMPRHTTITDRVNRAAADAMGTSEEGWSWTEVSGDIDIVSDGAFQIQGSSATGWARAETDLSSDDHAAQGIVTIIATTFGTTGPATRFDPSAINCYWYALRRDSGNRHRLFSVSAGTPTQIGTTVNNAVTTPLIAQLSTDGSTHTGYTNQGYGAMVQQVQATDSGITGNVRLGFSVASNSTNLSSVRLFRGWDIPVDTTENLGTQLIADAVWTWFNEPRAVYYNGAYYIGWIDSSGNVGISKRASNGTVTSFTLSAALEVDDHDNAAILIRTDGKIVCWYSKHGTDNLLRYRISTNAEDISAFDSEQTIASTENTYAVPLYLAANSTPYWTFSRGSSGTSSWGWGYTNSSDHSTWSSWTEFWEGDNTDTPSTQPYIKHCLDVANDKLHFVLTNNHPVHAATGLYHVYMDISAGTWHQSDGTQIVSGLPLGPADATLVYDGSTVSGWMWDITVDASGNPRILGARYPRGNGLDHRYMCWRWNGTAWAETEIIDGGHAIYQTQVYYSGGLCFDNSDPDIIYLSRRVANVFELQKWVTADSGATWTFDSTITKGSSVMHARPFSPKDHDGTIPVLWWSENSAGSYASYTSYDTAIQGLVVAAGGGKPNLTGGKLIRSPLLERLAA